MQRKKANIMQHVTHPFKLEYGVPGKAAAFGNNVGCYTDSRQRAEIGSQAAWHRHRSLHSRHLPCWSIAEQAVSLLQRHCSAADLWPISTTNFTWRRSSVKLLLCFGFSHSAEMNRIIWVWVFLRHCKRFNRDTAHTTKCSSSVSPHSSPDLPAIPRLRS